MRAAWQPFFFSTSMASFCGLMNDAADELVAALTAAAESGDAIDITKPIGQMTMQVVGTTAFGVDFSSGARDLASAAGGGKAGGVGDAAAPGGASVRQQLTEAVDRLFSARGITFSVYGMVMLFLPVLAPIVRLLAAVAPDKGMLDLRASRQRVVAAVADLISEERAKARAEAEQERDGGGGGGDGTPKRRQHGSSLTTAAPAPSSMTLRSGVAPGSFLALIARATDRTTGKPFTDVEVANQAFLMLMAGYETTANALAFTLYCLSQPAHAPKLAKLLAEIDAAGPGPVTAADLGEGKYAYVQACLKEALRLYPAAPTIIREAGSDGDVAGHAVRAGQWLAVSAYALQRDPQAWQDADAFIPERFVDGTPEAAAAPPHGWVAFGEGPRACIGWRFALQEATVALVKVFRVVTLDLEPGQEPLALRATITLSPKHGVHVRPRLRKGGKGGQRPAAAA